MAPTSLFEVMELFSLLSDIHEFNWAEGLDIWKWAGDTSGVFSVGAAKRLIISGREIDPVFIMKWECWMPLKCNILAWRAEQDRIATRVALSKRGMAIVDDVCPLCNSEPETSLHMFTACIFITEVWVRIAGWCRLEPIIAFHIRDLLTLAKDSKLQKTDTRVLHSIILTTLWCIWTERNDRVFQSKKANPVEVVVKIKAESFFWIRNRSRFKNIDWNDWCICPFGLM